MATLALDGQRLAARTLGLRVRVGQSPAAGRSLGIPQRRFGRWVGPPAADTGSIGLPQPCAESRAGLRRLRVESAGLSSGGERFINGIVQCASQLQNFIRALSEMDV